MIRDRLAGRIRVVLAVLYVCPLGAVLLAQTVPCKIDAARCRAVTQYHLVHDVFAASANAATARAGFAEVVRIDSTYYPAALDLAVLLRWNEEWANARRLFARVAQSSDARPEEQEFARAGLAGLVADSTALASPGGREHRDFQRAMASGSALADLNLTALALERFRQASILAPKEWAPLAAAARVLDRGGRVRDALPFLRRAASLAGGNDRLTLDSLIRSAVRRIGLDSLKQAALRLERTKDYAGAKGALAAALALSPQDGSLHLAMAAVQIELHTRLPAIASLQRARAVGRSATVVVRARTLLDSLAAGGFAPALTTFADSVAASGDVFSAHQRWAEAAAAYDLAASAEPYDYKWHRAAGLAHARAGADGEAAVAFAAAVALDPTHLPTIANLATSRYKAGNFAAAVQAYTAALSLAPTRADYYEGLGLSLLSLNRAPFAVQAFEEAVRLDPSQPRYKMRLDEARARAGRG